MIVHSFSQKFGVCIKCVCVCHSWWTHHYTSIYHKPATHTHSHTHTHTQTRMNTITNTHKSYIQIHIHTHSNLRTHTYVHTRICTDTDVLDKNQEYLGKLSTIKKNEINKKRAQNQINKTKQYKPTTVQNPIQSHSPFTHTNTHTHTHKNDA